MKKMPCEVFSRIVGYITVAKIGEEDRWNPGKALEFKDRKVYKGTVPERMR